MDARSDVYTLKNWKKAVELRKLKEANLKELTEFETRLAKRHREQHPLSPQTIKSIMDLYEKGQPLCCRAGRTNLEPLDLDECWLDRINNGFYDTCGSVDWRPGGRFFEKGKGELMELLAGRDF